MVCPDKKQVAAWLQFSLDIVSRTLIPLGLPNEHCLDNPSGRLPYTIAKNRHDYGVELVTNSQHPITPIDYQEGELFDYRRFQAFNIEPRYCFGHGLSYTRFAYSNFVVDPESSSDKFEGKSNPSSASLSEALHRPILKIRFDIKNEGLMKGTEVSLFLSVCVSLSVANQHE